MYSKTCEKPPISKRQKFGFGGQLSLNAGQKYCRTLCGEHSTILPTFIKLLFVIKIFVLSIFEWPFCTGFTVYVLSFNLLKPNGIFLSYKFDQSIFVLRVVKWYFHFHSNFNRTFCKQTVETLIRRRICGVWSGSALFAYVPQKRC